MATVGSSSTRNAFRNRIFILRHGEAESNVQDIIISDPKDGVPFYGLTEKGKQQAKEASAKLQSLLQSEDPAKLAEKLVIISSDFKRTRETAEIVHDYFKVSTPLRLEKGLRERGCGDFHKTPGENAFRIIFTDDCDDPTQTKNGCESLMNCVIRMSRVLASVDEEFENKIIVLVSHGDPLHVLWAVVTDVPPSERWSGVFPFITNCDLREIPNDTVQ